MNNAERLLQIASPAETASPQSSLPAIPEERSEAAIPESHGEGLSRELLLFDIIILKT